MFKKQIKISTSHKMSTKDRKKFKKDLKKYFDKESIDKLFFYVDEFDVMKVEKSKMVIYFGEGDPIFVDSTSKKDFFPSTYTIQMFPKMVKTMQVKQGVEKFIKKGAQLMWPGVKLESMEEFDADEVVGIQKEDGHLFAVGALAMGLNEVKEMDKPEGIASYILTQEGDELFLLGSKNSKNVIFSGEKEEKEEPEIKEDKIEKEEKIEKEDEDLMMNFVKNTKKVHKNKNKGKRGNKKDPFEDDNDGRKKGKGGKRNKKGNKKDEFELQEQQDKPQQKKKNKGNNQDQQKMNNYIMEAFLNAVKLMIDDSKLPLENADFWNNYILPCRNPEVTLDIKNSKFKKLGKFFSQLDKDGFITYKEASKKQLTPQITQIHINNDKINNWEVTIDGPLQQNKDDDEEDDSKIEIRTTIQNYIRAPNKSKQYMLSHKDEENLTYKQWVDSIKKFLEKGQMLKGNTVIVNESLQEDYGFEVEEESVQDEEDEQNEDNEEEEIQEKEKDITVSFDKLIKKMKRGMDKYYIVDWPNTEEFSNKKRKFKGEFQGVIVAAEKQHNRYVTRIENLYLYGVDMKKVLDVLRVKFDTSGVLKDSGQELVLQGTFLDQIKDYLRYELKLPEEQIIEINKVSKKKKKETFKQQ